MREFNRLLLSKLRRLRDGTKMGKSTFGGNYTQKVEAVQIELTFRREEKSQG